MFRLTLGFSLVTALILGVLVAMADQLGEQLDNPQIEMLLDNTEFYRPEEGVPFAFFRAYDVERELMATVPLDMPDIRDVTMDYRFDDELLMLTRWTNDDTETSGYTIYTYDVADDKKRVLYEAQVDGVIYPTSTADFKLLTNWQDESYLLLTDPATLTIYRIDRETYEREVIYQLPPEAGTDTPLGGIGEYRVELSPGGKHLLIFDNSTSLTLMNVDGNEPRHFDMADLHSEGDWSLRWVMGGDYLHVTTRLDHPDVANYLINAETAEVHPNLNGFIGADMRLPYMDCEGDTWAVYRRVNGVYTRNLETGDEHRVDNHLAVEQMTVNHMGVGCDGVTFNGRRPRGDDGLGPTIAAIVNMDVTGQVLVDFSDLHLARPWVSGVPGSDGALLEVHVFDEVNERLLIRHVQADNPTLGETIASLPYSVADRFFSPPSLLLPGYALYREWGGVGQHLLLYDIEAERFIPLSGDGERVTLMQHRVKTGD